ncbi:MAG: AmmeMemoRadiSam system radical SAM enzyme [Anaerolineae bacterium]
MEEKEAILYVRLDEQAVQCNLCAHRCTIRPGHKGVCRVRENREGTLYTLVYGKAISQAVDPVEKKPLFHFYPGSASFSVATVGCNFRCRFCQNADISQMPRDQNRILGQSASPVQLVQAAVRYGVQSISYTYTEPTIFTEYAYDTAVLARAQGLANNYVTNGYMTPEMLDFFHPYLDAANVDLKSFRDEFYRKECGARLEPVLESLRHMRKLGIWVEVTTLVIPGLNDSEEELRDIARFLVQQLGPEVPWHVSRFHPYYKEWDRPPTPLATLKRAREIGLEEGLRYVYEGNVPGSEGEHTFCYRCGALLIARIGFRIREYHLEDGRCPRCGTKIDGVGL